MQHHQNIFLNGKGDVIIEVLEYTIAKRTEKFDEQKGVNLTSRFDASPKQAQFLPKLPSSVSANETILKLRGEYSSSPPGEPMLGI